MLHSSDYILRISTRADPDDDVARFAKRGYLTLENQRKTKIVTDGGEYGSIRCQRDGCHCGAWTALEENIDEFAGKVLAVSCTASVTTDQYLAAVAQAFNDDARGRHDCLS